ncbi:MAG: MFS transporter [Candidatus Sumerlaeia bacterium]
MAMQTGRVLDGLKSGHLRWWILLLLFLSTVLNYLDRQVFSVLAPFIRADLQFSNTNYAMVVNAFTIGTILGLLVAGPFIDRFGARLGFLIAIVLWSIGGAFTGLSWGLISICIFRFLLGLGEAGNWPAASKAVAEWFPAKERAIAMGFFNGGVSIGAIVAIPAVATLIWMAGGEMIETTKLVNGVSKTVEVLQPPNTWRWPFVLAALFSIPWLYYWMKLYHPPEKHPRISQEEMALIQADRIQGGGKKSREVLYKIPFWGLFFARGITSPVWFFIAYWLFTYLHDVHGLKLREMAAIAWIPFATADIGNILGGYWSGKLVANGWKPISARIALMGVGAGAMLINFVTGQASVVWLALGLISILTFFWGVWVSNMLALAADSFPSREVASVMSWTGIAQHGGTAIFTAFTGWAVDKFANGYQIVFLAAALLPMIGFIFTVTMNRPSMVERANG